MKSSARSRASRSQRALVFPGFVLLLLAAAFSLAAFLFHRAGLPLAYGDAEAHLNIARRLQDSLTPGYEQIGTVWLPLPHWLMAPAAAVDGWWRSGAAGLIVPAICATLAAWFLYLAGSRVFECNTSALVSACVFALNPNLLYLASAPMTETMFFACQLGMLAALVWFAGSGSIGAAALAGIAGLGATLIRYDGWFLIAFGALVIAGCAPRNGLGGLLTFCLIAGLGPVYWLIHNRWFYGNWLEFYNGPYSAKAIQGDKPYPGRGDWPAAWLQYRTAVQLCTGLPLLAIAGAGVIGTLLRRGWWWLLLLASVPAFYIWSLHSGGTPIFVPGLWPNSFYNTRYGMAVLPLAAFAAAGLVWVSPERMRTIVATIVIGACAAPWVVYPRSSSWVALEEARVNHRARLAWTEQAASYLERSYRPGDRLFMSFGDLTGIARRAGIPLRETVHEGNGLLFEAALQRPDLFLWPKWVVAFEGDRTSRMARRAVGYQRVEVIGVEGARNIEIYRRSRTHPPGFSESFPDGK